MKDLIKLAFKLGYQSSLLKTAARDFDGMYDAAGRYQPSMEERWEYLHDSQGNRVRPLTNMEKRKQIADSARFYGIMAAMLPAGVAGGAAIAGLGETAASGIEGRSAGEALRRGATTAGTAFVGGHVANGVTSAARGIAARVGGNSGGALVDKAKSGYDMWQNYRSTAGIVGGAMSGATRGAAAVAGGTGR
jgi:hypothetical protein